MAPCDDGPFAEDNLVCRLKERYGLELSRFMGIEIYDEKAVKAAGMVRESVDYSKIRRALDAGQDVPGARMGQMQYTLKRRT